MDKNTANARNYFIVRTHLSGILSVSSFAPHQFAGDGPISIVSHVKESTFVGEYAVTEKAFCHCLVGFAEALIL